jgi:hypothetical protein
MAHWSTSGPLLRRFRDCGRARSAARSERRVVGAARGGRELRRVNLCSCSMASRPLCGSAARRVLAAAVACGVPVGSELLAFIQTPLQTRAALRCRRDQRMLRGMGLRIVEPRASRDLLCAAEPLASASASATDDAHHRRGVFIIKHLSFEMQCCWHSTLKPQRCSLSSPPLASLSSRHNSNCLSTLRSWISTTLLVRTDKRQGTLVLLTKKTKNKKHFFSLQVVLLHCARASRRLHRALAVL